MAQAGRMWMIFKKQESYALESHRIDFTAFFIAKISFTVGSTLQQKLPPCPWRE